MSADDDARRNGTPPQADVAGLFARFGGDARSYREFAPNTGPASQTTAANEAMPSPGEWPLLAGVRRSADAPAAPTPAPAPAPEVTIETPAAPVAPHVVATVAIAALPPVQPPASPPAIPPIPLATEQTASPLPGVAPRELDLLFARLAGIPAAGAEPGHGLMARWRRPT